MWSRGLARDGADSWLLFAARVARVRVLFIESLSLWLFLRVAIVVSLGSSTTTHHHTQQTLRRLVPPHGYAHYIFGAQAPQGVLQIERRPVAVAAAKEARGANDLAPVMMMASHVLAQPLCQVQRRVPSVWFPDQAFLLRRLAVEVEPPHL